MFEDSGEASKEYKEVYGLSFSWWSVLLEWRSVVVANREHLQDCK